MGLFSFSLSISVLSFSISMLLLYNLEAYHALMICKPSKYVRVVVPYRLGMIMTVCEFSYYLFK